MPSPVSAAGFTGKRKDRETFYSFTSFTTPTEIFRYNFDKRASELLFKPKVKFNPDDYTTEQVFYNSADGTRVPYFVVGRRDALGWQTPSAAIEPPSDASETHGSASCLFTLSSDIRK